VAEGQPHFRIAGIPIRIEWSFWLIAVFLGYGAREGWLLVAWVAIVLVSILVHELGHAFALRVYHQQPRVVLHAFGGLTYGSTPYRSRTQSVVVSAAGPLAAFLLLGLPAALYLDPIWEITDFNRWVIVGDIAWVNIAWSIVNLLPILPLDGGNIAATLFGRQTARLLSMVVAFSAATYFFTQDNQFGGFFLMLFAIMNFTSYQQERAGSTPAAATTSPTQGGPREDLFSAGARALAEGRTAQGLDALAAAYGNRPSGPPTLGPAQQLAHAGQAVALASRLLGARDSGPEAAVGLQTHLHYAACFRESANVGELVYADGRANRAQVAYGIACAAARLGENDRAMAWLTRAIDDGFRSGALLDGEPDLAPLRLRADWPATRDRVTGG
jgi:stage IV sporulation protein FB